MGFTPNRICLISYGRHDEAPIATVVYPGMLALLNSSNQLIPHNVPGGGGQLLVVEEDALRGGDITQQLVATNNPAGPFRRAAKGDEYLMLLQYGQNVAAQTALMSAGDGTLIANPGSLLANITAPSAVITNVGTETAFSNGSYTFPANILQVGDVVHVRAKAVCVAQNSTNTHRVRLYIGATPVTIADSTALALQAADYVLIDLYLTVRTITATGTIVASGFMTYTIAGTVTDTSLTDVSATLDSTIAEPLVIKSLASATSSGNQIRLDEFRVDLNRPGGLNTMVYAAESINNSVGAGSSPMSGFNSLVPAGAASFIRVLVP